MVVQTRIEDRGCGCGDANDPGGLITVDDAISRILHSVCPVSETEVVSLAAACGRTLAEAVCAGAETPPFDNAAMDGYAISSAGLIGAGPWRLDVTARIAAGRVNVGAVGIKAAAQIFTGAPIPQGADAVVMQEDVERIDGAIVISRRIRPGSHIRVVGEDMRAGDVVVPAGRHLSARDIAACAAAGAANVRVRRLVRVALLVTGDEVNPPGQPRNSAGIWDVNTPMLSAAIAGSQVELLHVETGNDNRDALQRQLCDLAGRVDLIVTTGGISVGEEDHVKPALSDLGGAMVFSGVAMKPGKPVSFGRLGSTHWLGLPGNPLSAYVTWQLFGTVLCRLLAGNAAPSSPRRHVVLSRQLCHKPGRCELRLAEFAGYDGTGREIVGFDDATHSGRVARLGAADGVILVPSEAENLPQGALVEFQPFCD